MATNGCGGEPRQSSTDMHPFMHSSNYSIKQQFNQAQQFILATIQSSVTSHSSNNSIMHNYSFQQLFNLTQLFNLAQTCTHLCTRANYSIKQDNSFQQLFNLVTFQSSTTTNSNNYSILRSIQSSTEMPLLMHLVQRNNSLKHDIHSNNYSILRSYSIKHIYICYPTTFQSSTTF